MKDWGRGAVGLFTETDFSLRDYISQYLIENR